MEILNRICCVRFLNLENTAGKVCVECFELNVLREKVAENYTEYVCAEMENGKKRKRKLKVLWLCCVKMKLKRLLLTAVSRNGWFIFLGKYSVNSNFVYLSTNY